MVGGGTYNIQLEHKATYKWYRSIFLLNSSKRMRSNRVVREHLTADAQVTTVLGSIPAYSDTVECEGRQIKQC
jgi:hypothetical protein